MIISFSHTTAALLAGQKTMTRRDWSPPHAKRFREGFLVDAWDRLPRVSGAKKVAVIRITKAPYEQWSNLLSPADYVREGFEYMREHGDRAFVDWITNNWRTRPRQLWVVEFELVERVP